MRLLHRLILLRYGIAPDFVLNPGPAPDGDAAELPAPALSTDTGLARGPVAAEMYQIINAMRAEAYDVERGRVDYVGLRASPAYAEFRRCARRLRAFDPAALTRREERLTFWINLYNALIVDGVIQLGVRTSVSDVPGFFWRAAYDVGGQRYCAHDIEHGVLRANASHPALPGAHFGPRDPRRRHSLERLDPRLHFALVCAARSCPPIAVYQAGHIDRQLDLATRAFVNGGGVEIDREAGEVRLSRIFQWYAPDFGARPFGWGDARPLLEFAARYLADDARREFVLCGRPAVRFQTYDWALNHAAG